MTMIAIQIAAAEEWAAARSILGVAAEAVQTYPFGEYFFQHFAECEVVLLHSGPAKTRAAAACQYAIDHWSPAGLIVLGTCGGVAADLAIGDIILADVTVQYDCIERMDPDGEPFYSPLTTQLDNSWLVDETAKRRFRVGTIGTADQDLAAESLAMLRGAGVLGVDWESGAAAKICALNRVPCSVLRGVSDCHGVNSGADFVNNTPRVMKRLLAASTELILLAQARQRL